MLFLPLIDDDLVHERPEQFGSQFCNIGVFLRDIKEPLYVKATVKNMNIPDGTYSNVVSMKSTSEDIVPTAEAGLSFSSSYDVTKSVEKVGGNAPTAAGAVSAAKSALAKAGDEVIYKVTVKNDGDSALSGVKITDNLPIGAYTGTVYCGTNMSSMTEVNVVANSFVIAGSATIPANGSVTYYVKTTVPTVILSGTYSNKVQMAVSVGGTTVTLQDSASIVIEEILDYSIEKTVYQVNGNAAGDEVPSVMLGDKVIYKITVKNDGNSDLVDTSINEILPGCASDAKYSPDMISWTEFADVNKTFPAGVLTEGVYSIPAGGTYTYYDGTQYYLSVEVTASAIQSTPASAVSKQWGVTVSDGKLSK